MNNRYREEEKLEQDNINYLFLYIISSLSKKLIYVIYLYLFYAFSDIFK